MAQQGAWQPRWFFDQARQLRFYHDPRTDEYVYEDGSRRPARAATTPRTPGHSYPPPNISIHLSSSPTQRSNYAHNTRGQQPVPAGSAGSQVSSMVGLNGAMEGMNIAAPPAQPSSEEYESHGIHIVDAQNPHSLVRTRYGTSPANLITDPALYNSGVRAHRMLYGTGGEESERLYSNFRLRHHTFFAVGRCFLILWVEPAGEASGSVVTQTEPSDKAITVGTFNEKVFSKVRRFVVIREGHTYCSALPIATYGGRGLSKAGMKKSEHAIIYTGREAPTPRVHEKPQRGEAGMRPYAIRVTPDDPKEALDPMSRLDFGKVHTIQHNIKVRPFGVVHPSSREALQTQFATVWQNIISPEAEDPTPSPSTYRQQATPAGPGTTRVSAPAYQRRPSSSRGQQYRLSEPVEEEREDDDDNDEQIDEVNQAEEEGSGEDGEGVEDDDEDDGGDGDEDDEVEPRTAQTQRPGTASSSDSAAQAAWYAQVQQARAGITRMIDQGFTREQAFARLVASLQQQGRTAEAADALARALLTGHR